MTVLEQQFMSAALSYFRRKQEFVRLHSSMDEIEYYINPQMIESVYDEQGITIVYTTLNHYCVKESVEDVLSQL